MEKNTAKINREGTIVFGDARFSIWEEGLNSRMTYAERDDWEKKFKFEVFRRVLWMLRKIGWETEIDQEQFADLKKRHGLKFAQSFSSNSRNCSYGDLKAHINLGGRTITFEMWQGINTPTRSDHGGRYEYDKEKIAPYLLRLRMERTRRNISRYLCNVFSGYIVDDRSPRAERVGICGQTATEHVLASMKKSGHYKSELGRASFGMDRNNLSGDKLRLENGMKVYAVTRQGRIVFGTAFYSLNDSWYVVTGKYDYTVLSAHNLYVNNPGDLKVKRNERARRSRLESELSKSIKIMDFKRAEVLKNILFPPNEKLFVIRHPDGLFHRANFSGYTSNVVDAGKFTAEEIEKGGYTRCNNKVIPMECVQ